MQTDLLGKIDTLIEMSKSTSNIDTLKAELSGINDEIDSKKRELDELRKSMNDVKYVKASDKIIDENIKVSLELKIRKLENSRKELDNERKCVLEKEEETHQNQKKLQEKKEKLEKLIQTLQTKIDSLSDSEMDTRNYYLNLKKEQEQKLIQTEQEANDTEIEYQKTTAQLNELTAQIEKLDHRITLEKEKLNDTVTNLSTNESYVDMSLKKEDEKRIESLEEKLESLETRKEEIQTDAVMIGNEAKELLLEDDRTGCFQKVKELVKIIKTKPFMDVASIGELENVLREAEEKAVLVRDEFASVIETKKYDGTDTLVTKQKEQHLEEQKQELEKSLAEKQAELREIDNVQIRKVNNLLKEAIKSSETLKSELANYKKVIEEENENSTPKKKAVLKAALNKKEEELESVHSIITSYEQELEDLIEESKEIADIEIKKITNKLNKVISEIKEMNKKAVISSKAKDVLAMENDRAKLKELNDAVKEIMNCKKYRETPSEIYDQIEMSLGSFGDATPKRMDKNTQNDSLLNNFRITNNNSELNRSEKNKDVLEGKEPSSLKSDFYIPVEEDHSKDFESETFTIPENDFDTSDPVPEIEPVFETPKGPEIISDNTVETTSETSSHSPFEIPEVTPPVEDFVDKGFDVTKQTLEEPINISEPSIENFHATPIENYEPPVIEEQPIENFETNLEPLPVDTIAPFEIPTIESVNNMEYQTQLENQLNEVPVEQNIEPPKERYRVINVEEIEPVATTATPVETFEPVSEIDSDDVLISDLKDDEYIDFDALLDGGNV